MLTDKLLDVSSLKSNKEIQLRLKQSSGAVDIYSALRVVEINIVDSCNRTCTFCPHDDPEYTYRYGRAKLALFETIATQLIEHDYNGYIVICGYGEPAMYKQLIEAVGILRKTKAKIELISNGELLTKDKVNKLFEVGLDVLNISVYEEQYVEHTKELIAGLDESQYLIRNRYLNQISIVNRREILFNKGETERTTECWLLAYKMLINHDGNVLMCCNDWTRTNVFGNVYEKSLWDIWTDDLKDKRNDLLNGVIDGVCKKCDVTGTDYGKESRDFFKGY